MFVFAESEDRIIRVCVLAQPSKFSKGLLAGEELPGHFLFFYLTPTFILLRGAIFYYDQALIIFLSIKKGGILRSFHRTEFVLFTFGINVLIKIGFPEKQAYAAAKILVEKMGAKSTFDQSGF